MQATFRTLQEHGFAGLSIGRIADEADLSKSSVYHFFEDKDDLMLSFLDAMLAHFGPSLEEDRPDEPESALWAHVDFALAGVSGDRFPPVESEQVEPVSGEPYVELRSQAVHDEDYRDRFTDIDARLRTVSPPSSETGSIEARSGRWTPTRPPSSSSPSCWAVCSGGRPPTARTSRPSGTNWRPWFAIACSTTSDDEKSNWFSARDRSP